MQSWSNPGQTGADEQSHQHQWQPGYNFAGQNGQFDPHQSWSQSVADQAVYSHINPQDAASNFFDSPHQSNSFLTGNLHGSAPGQPNFHSGHESLDLNQQFSQPGQDVMDPAFSDIHPDLYAQQGKMNLGDSMGHMNQVQSHPHAHSQNFQQYSFPPQNEHSYESPIQQFAQPHVIPQQNRQQSHTPVQQYDGLQAPAYAQGHGYSRPPQHSPVQNQQPYNPAFSPPAVNGQTSQPHANAQHNYQQPQPQQPQQQPPQQGFSQPQAQQQYVAQESLAYHQQAVPNQNFQQPVHQQPAAFPSSTPPPPATAQYMIPQQTIEIDHPVHQQPASVEPSPKKRKRAIAKSVPEVHTPEPTVAAHVDSPGDTGAFGSTPTRRVDEIDSLAAPTPTPEEVHVLAQFNKRPKAAQAKQPSIKGLPYLVYDASTKLPAPKSYDKLAPLVSLPPRSGKAMVPEFGYSLPCEVQGRFTSQYRPSPDKGGLDERRIEAKHLLDEFDRSMKALGKRRPKYTEYPHAFKEQLKSDEASKNKAEKKAKREQEEERIKPIRPATRPTDPAGAAAWDAVGIVNIDQFTPRTSSLIAGRVQQAGEYFIKLRSDVNRAKQDLDQVIKDKMPEVEIARRRQDFEQKKENLYRALDATVEHADDAVIDNLGGHQKLVLSLINTLIMCIKASDFSGKLPKVVLELFSHFPMTRKIAETTNFETVRKRFADKGDQEVKDLVRDISVKVKKVLKATEPDTSTGYTGTSAASRAKAATKSDHSTKRGRDDESDTRVVKKIAVESSGNSLSKKLAQPKLQLQSASKTTAAKAAANSILPGKSRPVAKSVPKPEAPKVDVKGVSEEKSRTEVKAAPRPETKVPLPKTVSSTSSALSGIASLLDSINAPKAEPVATLPREDKSPDTSETPEEKAKRLRKEARRKLRVSWKPEAELVQVKIFQKEDEEDEGRENNMIRDAGDDRSEGMVLKQRAVAEEDEDDDDIPYQPWLEPVATNFLNFSDEIRNKNFVTRGGNVTFTTDEQHRIAEREQKELMAIYTDYDDIPPTPKSPPPEPAQISGKTIYLPNDDPKFQEIQFRWRDVQQMGVDGALYAAAKRLDTKDHPSNKLDSILGRLRGAPSAPQVSAHPPVAPTKHISTPGHDSLPIVLGRATEDQVLAILRSDPVKNWRDANPTQTDVWRAYHYSDPSVHLCGNSIETVARSLAGKPFPATSPPEWIMHDEEKVREWHFGYNKELAARQKAEEEKTLTEASANALGAAAVNVNGGHATTNAQDWSAYYAQQQQAYAPYMALLQQVTGGQQQAQQQGQQPSAPSAQQSQIPDSQLQSILAAINQPSQQPGQAQASSAANFLNPSDPSYQQYMMLTQLAQGQQPAAQAATTAAAERDWDRERSEDQAAGRGEQRDGKDSRRKRGTLPPHKPANKALIGTKPCTFWQQGKCARGDKCTFRHD